MTKKKKGAIISFEVTDDGTLKQLGRRAKSASKDVDKLGKSTGDTRRNLQSMSGRTESASKSFSRLQQGTGGLVQSYAILASTVFAVTAAFRALENAQNIQQQIKGFQRLTEITGKSMLTITNNVREAANGLLDFQTAAQQTAIATAAGFSAEQIEGLTVGAKNASVALGRDMVDSFNRLIRGVTKAEPELLDELGVILRLDIATRNYAASIGASADKLTIAQRRTAVYNEVNKQLEQNFGAIGPEADDLTNQISAFTTSLGDIGIAISGAVLPAINALIGFLDRNKLILGGFLAIFALRLANDVIPGLSRAGTAVETWTNTSKQRIKDLNFELENNGRKYKKLSTVQTSATNKVSKAFRASLKKRGVDEKVFFEKSAANQKRSITAHINSLKKQEAATGRSMKRQVAIQEAAYKKIVLSSKVTGKKVGINLNSGVIMAEKGLIRLKLIAANTFGGIVGFAQKAAIKLRFLGVAANFAMGAFFAYSIGTMFYDMLPGVAKAKEAVQSLKEKTESSREEAEELNRAINGFEVTKLKAIGDTIREGVAPMMEMANALEHLSNILAQTDIKTLGEVTVEKLEKDLLDANVNNASRKEASSIMLEQVVKALRTSRTAGKGAEGSSALNDFIYAALDQVRAKEAAMQGAEPDELSSYEAGMEISAVSGAIAKVNEALDNMAGKKSDSAEFQNGMNDIKTALLDVGIGFGSFFEEVREGDQKLIKLTAIGQALFTTLDKGIDPVKTLVQSISDMKEPIDNLQELINLSLPKPNEFGKIGAALGQEFNQYDAALDVVGDNKEDNLLFEKLLTEAEIERARKLGFSLEISKVANTLLKLRLGLTEEEAALLLDNRKLVADTYDILNKQAKLQKAMGNLHKVETMLLGQLSDSHTKRLITSLKIENTQKEANALGAQILAREIELTNLQDDQQDTYEKHTQELITQKEVMEAQLTVLKNQLDGFFQLRKTMVESFDSAGNTALTDIIDGGSGTDAIRKMAERIKKDVAGNVAGSIMERATGGLKGLLGMGKEDTVKLTPEALAIKQVHDDHVVQLELVLQRHAQAFDKTMKMDLTNLTNLEKEYNDLTDNDTLFNDDYGVQNKTGDEQGGLFSRIFGKKDEDGEGGGIISGYIDTVKNSFGEIFGEGGAFHKTGMNLFGGEESVFGKLGKSLFGKDGALGKMFGGKEGGFMGGLGQMFGGGAKAGGGFLSSLFGGGGGGGGIMALLKPLLSMIPGIGPLLSILPFAKGGIIGNKLVGLAQGGVMPRYAKGGVATQPTYLVGEGKQNEAVVPLPDNRSIPVDLGKGTGNENNVSINVNMATGKTDTKSDAEDGKRLGAAINAAVMNEIEKQQRPGGMLAQG